MLRNYLSIHADCKNLITKHRLDEADRDDEVSERWVSEDSARDSESHRVERG